MNIILLITKPLASYREQLLKALKGTPYTDDQFVILCSTYEQDFNIETYEMFSELCDNVMMFSVSLAPYDPDKDNTAFYANHAVSHNIWRIPLQGETIYIPLGYVPNQKKWNKELVKAFRYAATDFYGPLTDDEQPWLSSWFICDGRFFHTNPCLRTYRKDEMFMHRARNYTSRSVTHCSPDIIFYSAFLPSPDTETTSDEPQAEPALKAKRATKKTAKKKRARNKTAKKKTAQKAKADKTKADKPSIQEAIQQLREDRQLP